MVRRLPTKQGWQKLVAEVVVRLSAALEPDYIVLSGGNAAKLDVFTGGFRVWQADERRGA